ncbi:MAG TPA: hypothetical protein VLL27_06310 [Solirubrobacterales bacterium]|nr:hypothetical protein [Solirubrobacterales bacterium]
MNFLKKGPELKLSEIKVPGFIQDVYYDLKDRHLLPIAALLLVALVAVPIALSQSGSEGEEPIAAGAGTSSAGQNDAEAGELVAKAAPGLRDYRRRLKHLRAKDPFIQQYAGGGSEESAVSTEASSSTASAEEGVYTEPSSSEGSFTTPTESSSGTETEGSNPAPGKTKYYSYAIDVKVSSGGSEESESPSVDGKPTVRHNLPELTMLPSREQPAIVYMGSTRDGKKALVVVSSDVDSVFGDAQCVLGSETCQMLALEPGLPETFVYGGSGKTYKIELLKIHLVESSSPSSAPLGEPSKKKQSSGRVQLAQSLTEAR